MWESHPGGVGSEGGGLGGRGGVGLKERLFETAGWTALPRTKLGTESIVYCDDLLEERRLSPVDFGFPVYRRDCGE